MVSLVEPDEAISEFISDASHMKWETTRYARSDNRVYNLN